MNAKGLLIDSGPLVALLNERDQYHTLCVNQAKTLRGNFYTAWPIVTEAAYLLKPYTGAVQKLLAWVRIGEIRLAPIDAVDVDGISRILLQYSDQNLDFADTTLMHLADRDGLTKVFTVDRKHFSVYRTSRRQSLKLVPTSW